MRILRSKILLVCRGVLLRWRVGSGVGAKAIAGAFGLDDEGVVMHSFERPGGDDRIAEDVAQFREATVRGSN